LLGRNFRSAKKKDIESILGKLERMNYSEWTKHDYKVTLKKFYKWLIGGEDYPKEVKWIKTTVKKEGSQHLPEELLTEEDVKKLIEAADHLRDKALVSVLYESGCRIGELASLKIKNVTFDEHGAIIIVNGKTGSRRLRILGSTPYLSVWLNNHPLKDNPEAPLWVSIGTKEKNTKLHRNKLTTQKTSKKSWN
jgi:site-specific recombinase XerD